MILSNRRTKLIWDDTNPTEWILYIDDKPMGVWSDAGLWERGLQGKVNNEIVQIQII